MIKIEYHMPHLLGRTTVCCINLMKKKRQIVLKM